MLKKLLLVATLCASCSIQLPDGNPVTERQTLAYNEARRLADILKIRLDAIVFIEKGYPPYGWVPCGQHTIAFNSTWLEADWARVHISGVAAHEACHLYFKDQMECKSTQAMEDRAEQCARDLLIGVLPK